MLPEDNQDAYLIPITCRQSEFKHLRVSYSFSYIFSNQQSSFQQPFNQYGLHPTYKWITGHIGYAA